jgi:hypothetical protein
MPSLFLRYAAASVVCTFVLASCSGGSTPPATPIPLGGTEAPATPATDAVPVATIPLNSSAKPTTFVIGGEKVSLAISASGAPGASLTVSSPANPRTRDAAAAKSCAAFVPPSINIFNPLSQPITIGPGDLKYLYILILTQCNVVGDGYNVALTQIAPTVGAPTTIGDVKGVKFFGGVFGVTGFQGRANASYTFAPKSTTQLSFAPATVNPATGYPYGDSHVVTFPPNTPTTLGSVPTASCSTATAPSPGCPNGSATQTTVALTTQTTSGGSASVDCFNESDPRFAAIPVADIAAFPGVVKGACEFDSGNATITLGTTVTFTIVNPDPDTAHGLLEGPIVQVGCTQTTSNLTVTATCPTTGPAGSGFTIGSNTATQYEFFLFGNDPNGGPQPAVMLSPSYVSVVAGTASNGYTFTLPAFASYPVTMTIDGDVNNNLSIAESNPTACTPGAPLNDMTQVAPGSLRINCNSGHSQGIVLSYNGGAWQYQHNGVAGQNQDCDASCVAYAAIDLYDGTGKTLLQGDGPGATINGTSTALATIDPLAVIDPATGALEDANNQTVNLPAADADPTGNTATILKVTEANINALNSTSIAFNFTQPTNGALFGLNTYYGGASFVTSGTPLLPVGSNGGLAHIPWGVGLNIQANQLGGTGLLFISPPEPAGQHAPPSGIISVNIPQAYSQGSDIQQRRRR